MFQQIGYQHIPGLLTAAQITTLRQHLAELQRSSAGTRKMLSHSWCRTLGETLAADSRVRSLLPIGALAVNCIAFEKSSLRNWLVSLHQDLSIPVAQKIEHPELSGWSTKEGQLYVHPPLRVLESLVALRLHIDPCAAEHGPLRVVPGSHLHGRLDEEQSEQLRRQRGETPCLAAAGDALLIRPLILHASSKAIQPQGRRVLHFLYGPAQLPLGLNWPTLNTT